MHRIVFILIIGFTCVSVVDAQLIYRLSLLKKYAQPLYRNPTKTELRRVAPDEKLFEKYGGFLSRPDTGLTKLVDDTGCAENTNVISAAEKCLKYSMPGGGSSFSFRTRNYRIARLADITYTDGSFQATGQFLFGVFANLGDIPIDRVSLKTKGMDFFVKYVPPKSFRSAEHADKVASVGFIYKGIAHRRALYVKENATFALRSIAYRGKLYRAVAGVTYNELDFDKRRDTIVVFRIVKKDDDGSLTILWKILKEQKSPKLKRGRK